MKPTPNLSNKTKAELTAMARRKKIPVSSGMVKDELIKTIKKGLRKIEAQKKSKTAPAKTKKRTSVSKAAKQTTKKKSSRKPKIKTARKPKSASPKTKTASGKKKQTPAKKKTAPKKSSATMKVKTKKTSTKKSAAIKPNTARSPKTVESRMPAQPVEAYLPERYGDHRLVLLARDPNWAYAYWDLNPTQVRNLLKSTGQTPGKVRWVLRVFSAALHPVEDKTHYFDVDTDVDGGNYYLNLSRPGARFIVELGVMDATGLFRSTAQSNPVIMPMDRPSDTLAQDSIFSEDMTSPSVSSFTKPPSSRSQ